VVHGVLGFRYDPDRDCLENPSALDVLEGPEPAPCPGQRCLEQEETSAVFVTNAICDVPPGFVDRTDQGLDACVKALEAYAREGHGFCPAAPDAGL